MIPAKTRTVGSKRFVVPVGLVALAIAIGFGVAGTKAAYQDVTHVRSGDIGVEVTTPMMLGMSKSVRLDDVGLGIGSDGNVYIWGRTNSGLDGTSANSGTTNPPTKVSLSGQTRQVTAGHLSINAVDKDGFVWGWGVYPDRDGTETSRTDKAPQRIRIGTAWNGTGSLLDKIVAVASTRQAGAGLRSDGTVWHWGTPASYGGTSTQGASNVSGLPDPSIAGNRPVYLNSGYSNFFVILENGEVYYWGGTSTNSLPSKLTDVGATATRITSLSTWVKHSVSAGAPYIVAISGGISMGAALLSNGSVLSWGLTGRIGGRTGTATDPTLVPSLTGIKSMQFSQTGVLFAKNDGTLWGYGASDDVGKLPTTPAQIDANVVQYSSTKASYLWQRADGTFWGRGDNQSGALGLPAGTALTTNRQISYDMNPVRV